MILKKQKLPTKERQGQIIKAALSIVANSGFKSLTTSAIAAKAGTSEANLYRHFKNKEEIIFETARYFSDSLKKNFENVFSSDLSSLGRIRNLIDANLSFIEANPGIPRFLFSEEIHLNNEKIRKHLADTIFFFGSQMIAEVKRGQKNKEISIEANPAEIGYIIIGTIQSLAFRWSLNRFAFPLAKEGLKIWGNLEKLLKYKEDAQ